MSEVFLCFFILFIYLALDSITLHRIERKVDKLEKELKKK